MAEPTREEIATEALEDAINNCGFKTELRGNPRSAEDGTET